MFILKSDKVPELEATVARECIVVNITKPALLQNITGNVTFYRDTRLDEAPQVRGWSLSDGTQVYTVVDNISAGVYVYSRKSGMSDYLCGIITSYSGFIPKIAGFKMVPSKDRGIALLRARPAATEYRVRVPNTTAVSLLPSMDHDMKDGNARGEYGNDGFDYKSALFALNAAKGTTDLVLGRQATIYGSGEVLVDGEFCFDNVRGLDYVISGSEGLGALDDFTIEMDYTITSNATGYCGFYGNKTSWSDMSILAQWGRNGRRPAMFWYNYFNALTDGPTHDDWVNDGVYHHLAWVRSGATIKLYSDGIAICQYTGATLKLNMAIQNSFSVGVQHVENACLPGRMKHFKINNTALYTEDFSDNLPVWVGM